MAQEKRSGGARARKLVRRYGLSTRAVVAGACVVATLLALGVFWASTTVPQGIEVERAAQKNETSTKADANESQDVAAQRIVVHVDGAVRQPGVYRLDEESPRVIDAVDMAGGLSDDANTDRINLALPVDDGSKVHIPREGEEEGAEGEPQPADASEWSADADGQQESQSGLVNINTADAAQLQTLNGVGEATAQAIIEDREQQGPFATPEDLMRVSGIGEKKFAKMREHICV